MRREPFNDETTKAREAENILAACIGRHGVWAGDGRYRRQCWTRDFAFATSPLLLEMEAYGIVRNHLEELSDRVRGDGKVPILYLDGLRGHARFLFDKTRKSVRDGNLSFMLGRYLEGELGNLTPGTRDSEVLYLLAMGEYAERRGRDWIDVRYLDHVAHALHYVESHLMADGLVTGADWRDTMEKELADKPLLTNNALFYRALRLLGQDDAAETLRRRIHQTHFANGAVLDYPGNDRPDPLGAAFAVLHDVVGPEHYPRVVDALRSVDSASGVTIKCRHKPLTDDEKKIINRTDGVVSWPFVVGFTTLALLKMGEVGFAERQFSKMTDYDGFREYYDPILLRGWGETNQLWSAALYLRAKRAIDEARSA